MTVALRRMEIQRNGNKKHGVVRFTEVIIMSGNNNQKSAGYAILGVIIVFAIIGFFVSLTEKEDPKCAFAGCDNTVSTEGGYCYQHNTPGKRRKAAYGTSSSHSHSTTMYSADDGNTEVFYFKNATATFSSFTQEPKVVKF